MFTCVIDIAGGSTIEATPLVDTVTFTTNAVGGFGSCNFTLPGLRADIPHLATIRVYYGTAQVWEGRIEDRGLTLSEGDVNSSFQCFGWKRLLDFTTTRRMWSRRSWDWTTLPVGGLTMDGVGQTVVSSGNVTTGQYDPADLTRSGVAIVWSSATLQQGYLAGAYTRMPTGIVALAIYFDLLYNQNGGGFPSPDARVWQSTDNGATWLSLFSDTTNHASYTAKSTTPGANCNAVAMVNFNHITNEVVDSSVYAKYANIRILGTSVVEDSSPVGSGGFYGGTVLRDLIALIAGLSQGTIESGTDFLIEVLDYSTRTTALQIVSDIAAYYAREWAVWEQGRFDWKTPSSDEAQWIVPLTDLTSLDLTGSVDTETRTAYVLYTDATTGLDAEASAAATSQRNPFVKASATKDEIITPGIQMTANTSAQLAAVATADHGAWPPVTGTVVVPARALIRNAVGSPQPAFLIRAGSNILIPGLPKTEILATGRDGETLFHIVSTSVDMKRNEVTLQLEGQSRYLDMITARLAAATRTITG